MSTTNIYLSMKQLCLNMIVKNESLIIERLLESVLGHIDCYFICDTGSTDNTREIITRFFEKHAIPGKVISEPFRDFGYNRTFAMRACEDIMEGGVKYILLLDADMVLNSAQPLISYLNDVHDAYYITQRTETLIYKNVRIVRAGRGMKYLGVTHEYMDTPPNTQYKTLPTDEVYIKDVGDGGSKSDKSQRDVMLLTRGLKDEPNNHRYMFYLANSLCDAGEYHKSIDMYNKRISIGGWNEEVWYCYYRIGKCYKKLDDMPNAIFHWLNAFQYLPERIESLYEIMNYYRCAKKYRLAYGIYQMAEERLQRTNIDHLFYQKDVYNFKMDYELSIIGYYCRDISPLRDYALVSMRVLNCPSVFPSIASNVLDNYKYYSPRLLSALNTSTYSLITPKLGGFNTSTPSICTLPDGKTYINVRHVNYRVRDSDGGYENPGKIITYNWLGKEGAVYNQLAAPNTEHFNNESNIYYGQEDVRLFYRQHDQQMYMTSNRGIWNPESNRNEFKVEFGSIDVNTGIMNTQILEFAGRQHTTEKNWVLFENMSTGGLKIIYQWHPLVIGDLENGSNIVRESHCIPTPKCLDHVRGSTNGVLIDGEWWFICHIVSYESRRHYYHLFVVLDATTFEVKRVTKYFTFEGGKVEYTLGFSFINGKFKIGYSVMDRDTKFIQVPKAAVDTMMMVI